MNGNLTSALSTNPDGLIVTVPSDDYKENYLANIPADLPFLVMNVGDGELDRSLGYVGQDETLAANTIADLLINNGTTTVKCIIHENFSPHILKRCADIVERFGGNATIKNETNPDGDIIDFTEFPPTFWFNATDPAFVNVEPRRNKRWRAVHTPTRARPREHYLELTGKNWRTTTRSWPNLVRQRWERLVLGTVYQYRRNRARMRFVSWSSRTATN